MVRRWLCSYSSRALVATYVDLLTGLRLLLFALLFVSLFGPLVLWGRLLLAFSVHRVPSLPWEGAVVVLSVSRLFVDLVFFPVEEFFFLCLVLLPLLGSCLSYVLDFDDFLVDFCIWACFAAFSELRGVRQVERFAECSFRHLRQVVFNLAGSLGVFLNFAAPDPGGC